MSFNIIIRGKTKYGKTRAEQEANLRKDGLSGMKDENYSRLKWLEKKMYLKRGFTKQVDLGG
jgi:hypothetical protein